MAELPKYIQQRGNRYRIVFPAGLFEHRYHSTHDSLAEAVAVRDAALLEIGVEPPDDDAHEQPNTAEFAGAGNYADASSTGDQIGTLAQLIEACDVDLDVWRVRDWSVKAWDGYAKKERADITWRGGAIDEGYVKKLGIETKTLYSVHASFIRRELVAVQPTIQPIVCPVTFEPPAGPGDADLVRTLVLADPHFWFRQWRGVQQPIHDTRALDIALQIADEAQPDRVDVLGDLLDMTDWTSKFVRSPEYCGQTQAALRAAYEWLYQIRSLLPDAEIRLYEGNHEARMRDALLTHLPVAYGLKAVDELDLPPALSLPKLLALHQLQIEWVGDYPDELGWLNDVIRLSHGDQTSSVPGGTARNMISESTVTHIFGHIHRREWVSQTLHTRHGQRVIEGFCPGCLCHVDGRVPASKGELNWQQGLAVVDYEPVGTHKAIVPIAIEQGAALWNGRRFVGDDGGEGEGGGVG